VEKYISGDGLLAAAFVVLALAWAYNMISTARSNLRAEKLQRDAPIAALRGDISTLRNDLAADRERIGALERDLELHSGELRDLHQGQTELCRGVQALLEFNLGKNGTEEEMRSASESIGKWLRNR